MALSHNNATWQRDTWNSGILFHKEELFLKMKEELEL